LSGQKQEKSAPSSPQVWGKSAPSLVGKTKPQTDDNKVNGDLFNEIDENEQPPTQKKPHRKIKAVS